MEDNQRRLNRERHTIRVMIEIYCRKHHHPVETLCAECRGLLAYAMQRIDKCPYQIDKPACAGCSVHCYKPALRAQVRQVMGYAGSRMAFYHPVLTVLHYVDGITSARKLKTDKEDLH